MASTQKPKSVPELALKTHDEQETRIKRVPLTQPTPKLISKIQEEKPKYDLKRSELPPDSTWSYFVPVPEIKESFENDENKEMNKTTKLFLTREFDGTRFCYFKFGAFSKKNENSNNNSKFGVYVPDFSPKKEHIDIPRVEEKQNEAKIEIEPMRVDVSIQPTKTPRPRLIFPVPR